MRLCTYGSMHRIAACNEGFGEAQHRDYLLMGRVMRSSFSLRASLTKSAKLL
jgi:hypothetical protein